MKLYELTDEYLRFADDYDNGLIPDEAVLDTLDSIAGEIDEKVESIACLVKNLRAEAEAIKAEEANLKARRESKERQTERIKFYLQKCLLDAGLKKVETPKAKVSFRHSKSVEIEDESAFIRWAKATNRGDVVTTRIEVKPNKTEIKRIIESGEEIAFCTLKEKDNVQIN